MDVVALLQSHVQDEKSQHDFADALAGYAPLVSAILPGSSIFREMPR